MSAPADHTDADSVPCIEHDEFRSALPAGRLRVIVDPAQARPWVGRRTHINAAAAALIGLGAVLALGGQVWPGGALVAIGIVARRLVLRHAPGIALHLALKNPAAYAEVTGNGVMEVRRTPQASRPT